MTKTKTQEKREKMTIEEEVYSVRELERHVVQDVKNVNHIVELRKVKKRDLVLYATSLISSMI